MNNNIALFIVFEFAIGIFATCWFVAKKIMFPVIDFIVDYLASYDEFKKWRKCCGQH